MLTLDRHNQRVMDRTYGREQWSSSALTDNSWLKEFTISMEITLQKEKYVAFSHGPRGNGAQYVVLQPFILERTHILFITHLIIVHDFPPHIICSSVLLVPGARSVRSCLSQWSERGKMRPERWSCLSFSVQNNSASVQHVPELKGWLCQLWHSRLPPLRHLEVEM